MLQKGYSSPEHAYLKKIELRMYKLKILKFLESLALLLPYIIVALSILVAIFVDFLLFSWQKLAKLNLVL